jgi:hypothetical protein
VDELLCVVNMFCPCGSVVEHSLGKGEVTRSIRVMGTKNLQVNGVVGSFNKAKIFLVTTKFLIQGVGHGQG